MLALRLEIFCRKCMMVFLPIFPCPISLVDVGVMILDQRLFTSPSSSPSHLQHRPDLRAHHQLRWDRDQSPETALLLTKLN